jgi:hypothetical protein
VPPPPVAGGAVTAGVCVTVTVAVGATVMVGVTVALGDPVAVREAVALGDAVAVRVTLGEGGTVAGLGLPPTDVGGAEPLADGRKVVADAEGEEDAVQPATAADPRTIRVP